MTIIMRTAAKLSGLKRYFTGEPCAYGHIAERRVSDYGCVECSRLKARDENQRDRRREYFRGHQRRYREKRPDLVKATEDKRDKAKRAAEKKALRIKDPEKHKTALSRSFQKHKTKRMAENKEWKRKHKEAVKLYMRAIKVMRRAAEGRFGESDIIRMLAEQNNLCVGCSVDISTGYHVDHIKSLRKGGTHWPSNLQLMCGPCNRSKGTKTMAEWIAWKTELGRTT
jgi:5-methylcytosine-specific restriction endonuclease McrA